MKKVNAFLFALLCGALLGVTLSAAQSPPDDPLYADDSAAVQRPFDAAAFAQTFSHCRATINNLQIHYVTGGKGDPILLIHGWPESWYSWRRVMPALAEKYTVIAVDMPGFGDSPAAPSADKKIVAAYLFGLMQSLGNKKFYLVGHDMGGPVAFALAAAHPDAVTKLVMSETAIPGHNFADGSPNDILTLTPQSAGGVWHFPFFMKIDMAEMLITGHERAFVAAMCKDSFYNPAAFGDDELDELTRWLTSPGGIRGGLAYYKALFDDVKTNRTEYANVKLTMPVLTIDGGAGFLQYVTSVSVGQVATNVRKVVVPKSGHFIAAERPGYLSQELLRFFAESR